MEPQSGREEDCCVTTRSVRIASVLFPPRAMRVTSKRLRSNRLFSEIFADVCLYPFAGRCLFNRVRIRLFPSRGGNREGDRCNRCRRLRVVIWLSLPARGG